MKQPFEISTTRLTHQPPHSLTIPSFDYLGKRTVYVFYFLLPLQDPLGIHGAMHNGPPSLPSHHGVLSRCRTWIPRIYVRKQRENTRAVLRGSANGLDMTSRLIEPGPFDLPSRWSKGQRSVFQPPGSRPPPSWVATLGKRVASFSLCAFYDKQEA